jgi:hypothetical protein
MMSYGAYPKQRNLRCPTWYIHRSCRPIQDLECVSYTSRHERMTVLKTRRLDQQTGYFCFAFIRLRLGLRTILSLVPDQPDLLEARGPTHPPFTWQSQELRASGLKRPDLLRLSRYKIQQGDWQENEYFKTADAVWHSMLDPHPLSSNWFLLLERLRQVLWSSGSASCRSGIYSPPWMSSLDVKFIFFLYLKDISCSVWIHQVGRGASEGKVI